MKTFCAKCQIETEHAASVSGKDVVLTCPCGHFIKFPSAFSKEEMEAFLASHKTVNARPAPSGAPEEDAAAAVLGKLGLQ